MTQASPEVSPLRMEAVENATTARGTASAATDAQRPWRKADEASTTTLTRGRSSSEESLRARS
eukprot:3039055-Alexandrium_andersonii.AAC.1